MSFRATVRRVWGRTAIRNRARDAEKIRVILGAGSTKIPGWISTDYPALDIVDYKSWRKLFAPEQIDGLLAEHVFEHLTDREVELALSNCLKFLRRGRHLRIAVPDGYHPSNEYIEMVKPGGSGLGSRDHKQLFNYQTLSARLMQAGFGVDLLEWFDEEGCFHYKEWAEEDGWVSRSSHHDKRNVVTPLSYTSLILDGWKGVR